VEANIAKAYLCLRGNSEDWAIWQQEVIKTMQPKIENKEYSRLIGRAKTNGYANHAQDILH